MAWIGIENVGRTWLWKKPELFEYWWHCMRQKADASRYCVPKCAGIRISAELSSFNIIIAWRWRKYVIAAGGINNRDKYRGKAKWISWRQLTTSYWRNIGQNEMQHNNSIASGYRRPSSIIESPKRQNKRAARRKSSIDIELRASYRLMKILARNFIAYGTSILLESSNKTIKYRRRASKIFAGYCWRWPGERPAKP